MTETFLQLESNEQAQILQGAAQEFGRAPEVIEKDLWVCWTLQQLFEMPGRYPMAFKGGTSLSKVFNAIHRFSEDIDVTIDHRSFGSDVDPLREKLSSNQRKAVREFLNDSLKQYINDVITPYP